MEIVTREQWGAEQAQGAIPDLAYPVFDVFEHHEGGAVFTATDRPSEVAWMHMLQHEAWSKGYFDFPYGCAVMPSGRIYEGRDLGFVGDGGPLVMEAATGGHNGNSIAVVWPGNFETQTATPAQIQGTADILLLAIATGRVERTFNYIPHSGATGDSTDCPGVHGREAMPPVLQAMKTPSAGLLPAPTNGDDGVKQTYVNIHSPVANQAEAVQVQPNGDILVLGGAMLYDSGITRMVPKSTGFGPILFANYPAGEAFLGAVEWGANGFMLLSLQPSGKVAERHYAFSQGNK